MIAGRISEQNFNTMLEKTQTEQAELKAKVSEGRKRLSDEVQLANDAKQWVEAIFLLSSFSLCIRQRHPGRLCY